MIHNSYKNYYFMRFTQVLKLKFVAMTFVVMQFTQAEKIKSTIDLFCCRTVKSMSGFTDFAQKNDSPKKGLFFNYF